MTVYVRSLFLVSTLFCQHVKESGKWVRNFSSVTATLRRNRELNKKGTYKGRGGRERVVISVDL